MKKKLIVGILLISMFFNLCGYGFSEKVIASTDETINGESEDAISISITTDTKITNLQVDGQENALGIDSENPTFSWEMESSVIGESQKSYHLVVIKDEDSSVVWDSGVVDSSSSVGITYEGETLKACTQYDWTVTLVDMDGNTFVSDEATFETSLLDTSIDAWDGAEWIGADELSLDATGSTLFDITSKVLIPEGSMGASFVFGANDFRLDNDLFNIDSMEGENYIRVELDLSDMTSSGGAAINIYRVGYFDEDSAQVPYMTINSKNNPGTNIDELITYDNMHEEHSVKLSVVTSTLTVTIDGIDVITSMTEDSQDGSIETSSDIVLSDLGNSDAMTFPNLNSIGFAADPGETAIFTDFELQNPAYGTGVLFGENIGASYSIWSDKPGISIDANQIRVSNDGEETLVSYADPSYGSEPYLRTEFDLDQDREIKSARLYVSFQGIGDIFINGDEIAPEEWFKQGSMEYREEIGYNVYDVTDNLSNGSNAMGVIMGEGWWTGHAATYDENIYNYYGDKEALLSKLVVTFEDGTSQTIVSDQDTWQYCDDGPVRFASLFEGERYDATKDENLDGFSKADYDTTSSTWRDAEKIETRSAFADQKLVVRYDDEVHVIRELDATLMGATKEGSNSYIYDLGENVAAVPQITIPEEYAVDGETITIRVAEMLYPDLDEYGDLAGELLQENYRAALTTDFYTMKSGEQTYIPDLTFHGYRYIEITGLDEPLPEEDIKSLVLSSIDNTATYDSSNELVNRLFLNGQNSEASNYITLPTDCPQRNERMGWMGDANVYALAGSYNADTYNFMRQWLACVRETQGSDGMTGHTSPNYPSYDLDTGEVDVSGMSFGITWNSAIVFIPYYLYMQYGDTSILEDNMDAIYSYMENLENSPYSYEREGITYNVDALTSNTGFLCDHLSIATTDSSMLGNALYTYALEVTSEMAEALGQTEKASKYSAMYDEAKEAWNQIFIDKETGKTCSADGTIIHTQASYASPLNYGVVSDENIDQFLSNYIDTIENPVDDEGEALTPYTLTTGFNATPNVLNALSDHGYTDIAYKMLECTDYASWLYPVTQGATSIWERWNSYTEEDGFGGNNSMNSFNHYSLGAVSSWIMDTQLGIKYDQDDPGYQHFILQPTIGGSFTYANGSFDSAYGTISSGWKSDGTSMTAYTATVPANTSATLYLPISEEKVSEIDLPEGATYEGMSEHNGNLCAEFDLVSGTYDFELADQNE